MTLTKDETLFIEFLNSFPQFYKKAHEIAENTKGISILPMDGGKNEFKMYALDDICHSCEIFRDGKSMAQKEYYCHEQPIYRVKSEKPIPYILSRSLFLHRDT